MDGLQQHTCNERMSSKSPALTVPRLQTCFILNNPPPPASVLIYTHTPGERIQDLFRGLEESTALIQALPRLQPYWGGWSCCPSANWRSWLSLHCDCICSDTVYTCSEQNKSKEKRAQRQDRQPRVKAKGGWRDNRKGEAADRLGRRTPR